jgi:hypothetical protein
VSLLVVPPSSAAEPEELWRRFASIVGAPLEVSRRAPGSNRTLGVDETELVRRMYRYVTDGPPSFPTQRVMRQIVSRQLLAPRHDVRRIKLPEACRAFVAHHTARRKHFVASSGCRIVGDPEELDLDPTRFAAELDRPDDARVLDAAIEVIVELSKRLARPPVARTAHDDAHAEVVRRVHQRLEGLDRPLTLPAPAPRWSDEAALVDAAVKIAAGLVDQLAARRARSGPGSSS